MLSLGISAKPAPKAYLQYIFFDEKHLVVDSKTVNVSTTAGVYHKITLPQLNATTNGYVQIFVANESNKNVYFDNLKITYTEALLVQENHYDPFGLNLTSILHYLNHLSY